MLVEFLRVQCYQGLTLVPVLPVTREGPQNGWDVRDVTLHCECVTECPMPAVYLRQDIEGWVKMFIAYEKTPEG